MKLLVASYFDNRRDRRIHNDLTGHVIYDFDFPDLPRQNKVHHALRVFLSDLQQVGEYYGSVPATLGRRPELRARRR